MKLEQRNTRKQGDVAIGAAIAYFSGLGYTVALPLTDSQPYDLIIDNGSLSRVQVKYTSTQHAGIYYIRLQSMAGKRNDGTRYKKDFNPLSVDAVFVLTSDKRKFLVPTLEIKSQRLSVGGDRASDFGASKFEIF
jgi:PD-(D/E)XK endonuclease